MRSDGGLGCFCLGVVVGVDGLGYWVDGRCYGVVQLLCFTFGGDAVCFALIMDDCEEHGVFVEYYYWYGYCAYVERVGGWCGYGGEHEDQEDGELLRTL